MCSIVVHNVHENIGRVQEGGTSMLMFGPLIEYLDMSEVGKDMKGLGCWVVMTLRPVLSQQKTGMVFKHDFVAGGQIVPKKCFVTE